MKWNSVLYTGQLYQHLFVIKVISWRVVNILKDDLAQQEGPGSPNCPLYTEKSFFYQPRAKLLALQRGTFSQYPDPIG